MQSYEVFEYVEKIVGNKNKKQIIFFNFANKNLKTSERIILNQFMLYKILTPSQSIPKTYHYIQIFTSHNNITAKL